jgi:hypothetical protein
MVMDNVVKPIMSTADLAHLGGGILGYVFCLYNANGAPISISQNYQAAIGSAIEHDLIAASVH